MMMKQQMKWLMAVAVTGMALIGSPALAASHTVQSGDTLTQIAADYHTTVETLVTSNNIADANLIHIGQVLTWDEDKISEQTTSSEASAETEAVAEGDYSAYVPTIVLSNGNTAGQIGMYAATKVAEATGTDVSTWEYIIAKESNGDPTAYNPSGASGLFQTMPFWGDTSTVEAQIEAAIRAYLAQGFAAWGL